MTKQEKEAENCATSGRSEEKPTRFRHGNETHGHETQNNKEADRMGRPLAGTVRAEGHEMLQCRIGRVLGRFDRQPECNPMSGVKQ